MSDLGNRANVNSAIDLLLDDTQPNEAIQPSDHNTLLKNILDTLSNGLSVTLRTNPETSGQDIKLTAGDKLKFKDSGFVSSLLTATLTADRTLTLPDATGTIALIGDIFTAGSGITENAGQIDLGGTLTIDAIINGAGNRNLKLGTNVLNENLSILEKNSIQAFERYANSFPFVNSGLEIIKNPGNFIGNLKSSATDYVQFRLTSDEFLVNSILGTNILAHQSSSTLSQTIVSDTSGGTSSRLELYGSGRVNLGTNGSVGASIVLDSVNTFTDRNTTAKGLEYALDYSANYTDRSLVDKAFVLANAGGDSIYTANGTLTGDRTVDLNGNDLDFKDGNLSSTLTSYIGTSNPQGKFFEIPNNRAGYLDGSLWFRNLNNSTGAITPHHRFYSGSLPSYVGAGTTSADKFSFGKTNNNSGAKFEMLAQYSGMFIHNNAPVTKSFLGLLHLYPDTGAGTVALNVENPAGSIIMARANANREVILRGTNVIGSEDISLQGQTAIKGIGTVGSSALAIYDGQGTPVKLWDFLDNGNVSITQSSSFLLSANKTLKVDGSSNTNQNSFEVNSASSFLGQGTFKIGTYGKVEIQSRDGSGTFKVLTTTGNEYFTLDANGNQSTLRTKAFDIGTSTTTGYKISSDSGKHQFIRNGIVGGYFDLVNSTIQFWEAGMTSRKFIVGGSALIGTEKISLQGDTLLNAKVSMPNLPTSATGLSSGDLWNDGGNLKIA